MESAYTFSDVMFEPQYSDIESRQLILIGTKLKDLNLRLPVISANMADITEKNMVCAMWSSGGLGILHRFMSIEDNVKMFLDCVESIGESHMVGVSIGVGEDEKNRFRALHDAGATTFCIDVAHGHHINVRLMLEWIRANYNTDELVIIAGNVASVNGALDLFLWGADVVKVGVGPGSCCQTRENTGVGVPQLYILEKIRDAMSKSSYYDNKHIIADGGLKKTGDIAKALKYADAVMLGGMLAGTTETPGHVYETMSGEFYKTMAGSASAESKVKSGKENAFVEGGIRQVPFRGHVKYVLRKIQQNVQSSFSYSGSRNLKQFQQKSKLIKISGGGKQESKL